MFLTFIVFLLILSILVLIHELGHFLAAKRMGIKVEEFGFGLPPRVWGKREGETVYSINWLPIGGFVKLYGEEREEENKERRTENREQRKEIRKRAFYARPVWQRSVVLMAGVIMNFLLGVIIVSFLFTQGVLVPTDRVHIEKVLAETPAEQVGLKEKDIIKKLKVKSEKSKVEQVNTVRHLGGGPDLIGDSPEVEEVEIKKGDQLTKITKEYLGEEIILVIVREEQEQEVAIIPREEYPSDQGPMGIVISNFEERKYSWWQAPILGTKEAFVLSFELLKGIGKTLYKLITLQPVSQDVAGPIGIAQMTGQAVKFGNLAVLELLGLLSLNLAIVNILPFPALDGGRLMFILIEGATGKKIRAKWERYIHQIGMAILLSLMALVAINDLIRIFSK